MTQDHPQNAAAALDVGAVTAVVAAMRAPHAAGVGMAQLAGCCALSRILSAAGTLGGACDGAAADAVIAAMNAQTGDRILQLHGCIVLGHIFEEERIDSNAAAWVRRRGAALAMLTVMMRAHRRDAEVMFYGCGVLSHLMRTQNDQHAAGIGSAIEALVAALRACPAATDVQYAGLAALAAICENVLDNKLAAAASGALEVIISAIHTHALDAGVQTAGCCALTALVPDMPQIQTRAGVLGAVEVLVAALRSCAVPLPTERVDLFHRLCKAMVWLLHEHPINKHKTVAASCMDVLVVHMHAPGADASVFGFACRVFGQLLGGTGHEARAIIAGALEALETRRAEDPDIEPIRLQLVRDLQPAARRHDDEPCSVAGCKRCATARARGAMCALPGCGARRRDGGAKTLLRCGTCRAACYCGPAHQREDWRRHKGECGATAHDDDIEQTGGAS